MKEKGKRLWRTGCFWLAVFLIWTVLVQRVDVQPIGVNGTRIGFATINGWFHKQTGVHMDIYTMTDWMGLVPVTVCMMFGGLGLGQLLKRRSLFEVDHDIILLGIYYVLMILGYLIFEMMPINYRPILIDGIMEASYPSSTTFLVLSVMLTLIEQVNRRSKNKTVKRIVKTFGIGFSVVMVVGRLFSGVHWLTDIAGSIWFSMGLFFVYKAAVLRFDKEND